MLTSTNLLSDQIFSLSQNQNLSVNQLRSLLHQLSQHLCVISVVAEINQQEGVTLEAVQADLGLIVSETEAVQACVRDIRALLG
jgi:phosphopantetheine adenylyltransferase